MIGIQGLDCEGAFVVDGGDVPGGSSVREMRPVMFACRPLRIE